MKDSHDDVQDLFDDESPEMHNDIEEKQDGFDAAEEDFDDELEDDFDDDELDDEELDDDEPEEEPIPAAPRRPKKFKRDFEDDDENDELFTRKNKRGGGYSGGQNDYVKYGILAVAVVAVILLVILLFRGKSDDKTPATDAATAGGALDATAGTEAPVPEMEKDTNPEVGELMNSFYTARQTADLSAMTNLVDTTANLSAQKLEKMTEYIENYSGITCYTRDGLKAGEYLVYVYCDVKFLNIDTKAPDLQWYYVKTAEDGHLYICTEMTAEENTFAQEQGSLPEVRALVQDVNDRLAAAMASDTGLNNLVNILNGGGDAAAETPAAQDPAATDTTAAADTTTAADTTETSAAETPSTAAASSDSITVWAQDGPYAIRKEPSRESDQIGTIYKGDHASRTELGSEWSKIEYVSAEGETIVGYVLNDALTTTSPE